MQFGIRANVCLLIMQIFNEFKKKLESKKNSCYNYDIVTNALLYLNH